jgi:hypothetical protein
MLGQVRICSDRVVEVVSVYVRLGNVMIFSARLGQVREY